MGSGDGEAGGLVDRDGNAYSWAQPLRLLDSFDVHLAQRADGSGHAVVEPGSGTVLVTGDTAGGTWDNAQRIAAQLGRRRVQAAIDAAAPVGGAKTAVSSAPAAGLPAASSGGSVSGATQGVSWQDLYDRAARQASDWQILHHNGSAPDRDTGLRQYNELQGQLRSAIVDPGTPDEARLPLATAGYQLYVGANAAGLTGPENIPYSAAVAAAGAMGFSGGGVVGPRVASVPRGRGLLPTTTGNRTAVAVEGELPNAAGAAPRVAGLEVAAPGSGVGGAGLKLPAVATLRPTLSQAAAESPVRGLSPPDAVKVPLRGGGNAPGLAGPEQAVHSSSEAVRTSPAGAGDGTEGAMTDVGTESPAGAAIRRSRGVTNPEIGKLPLPPVPKGMSRAAFGAKLIKWGQGPEDARRRMTELTAADVEEMRAGGATKSMAEQWRDFYANDFKRNSNNITAKHRVDLMQKIIDNLQE